MEDSSRGAERKAEIIFGTVIVLVLVIIYFSPAAISSRYRNKIIQFPDDGYIAAEDSKQFAVTATITLTSNEFADGFEKGKEFIDGKLHLEIYNIGTEPLLDFRWIGEIDPALHEYLAWGRWSLMNDPGISTRYPMLLSQVRSPKHDMYHRDADLPDYEPATRRQPTRGFIYDGPLNLWHTTEANELDVLLARVAKPIRLKLLHEGGTELLSVKPEVDSTGLKK